MKKRKIRKTIGILRTFFDRGRMYIQMLNTFVIFLLGLKAYELNDMFIFPLTAILLVSSVVIGWVDYRWGYWKEHNQALTKLTNPVFKEMYDDIKEIKKELKSK